MPYELPAKLAHCNYKQPLQWSSSPNVVSCCSQQLAYHALHWQLLPAKAARSIVASAYATGML